MSRTRHAKDLDRVLAESRRVEPHEDARGKALEAAQATLSRIVVVGGAPMEPCVEPILQVVVVNGWGGEPPRVEVGWRFPDYSFHDDPHRGRTKPSLQPVEVRKAREEGRLPHFEDPFLSEVDHGAPSFVGAFSLDDEREAQAFAAAYAPMAKSKGTVHSPTTLVHYVDASALTRMDPVPAMVDAVTRSFGRRVTYEWSSVLTRPDDRISEWMRARSLIAALAEGGGTIDEAMDAVAVAMDGMDVPHRLRSVVTRWTAVERHRDPALRGIPDQDGVDDAMARFVP